MALFRPYQQTSADERAEAKAKAAADRAEEALAKRTAAKQSGSAAVTSTGAATSSDAGSTASENKADSSVTPATRQTPKKDRPTPTRAEAEAARKARVNPPLTPKEAKARLREQNRVARTRAFDEAENEPTRVLLRDYIDARWSITEFLMPVMILLAALSIGFGRYLLAQQVFSLAMVALFAAWIINVALVWRGFKKQARERLSSPQFRGLLMYANNRMLQIRRFRRPTPRINRGDSY